MNIGFIGTGNMGSIIATIVSKAMPDSNILLSNRTREKAENLARKLIEERKSLSGPEAQTGKIQATSNMKIAMEADYIFLGVKPQMMEGVLLELSAILKGRMQRANQHFVLISMAAALGIEEIHKMLACRCHVIRIQPNTACLIGEGIILYSHGDELLEKEVDTFLEMLAPAGIVQKIPENLMDAGCAISGCGPAFAFLFLEALSDGGVACGLKRDEATNLAAQMLAGAGKLLLTTGKNPSELKNAVCSPAGTTIEGIRALEQHGFRSAAMEAVIASYQKNELLRKR